MRAVNLLPDPRTDKRHADRPSRLRSTKAIAAAAGAVLVFVAAVSGVAFTKARSDVSDRQSTLNGLQAAAAGVQAKATVSAAAVDQTQAHLAAVSTAASGRIAWDGLLDQLSRVMPRGAWLDQSLPGTNRGPGGPGARFDFDAQRSRCGRRSDRLRGHGLCALRRQSWRGPSTGSC